MLLQSTAPSVYSQEHRHAQVVNLEPEALDCPLSEPGMANLETRRAALEMYRSLAATKPESHRSGLAMSLDEMAKVLWTAGRPEEALETAVEATDVYRALASDSPELYRSLLGRSLIAQGQMLLDSGRRADAMIATQEAVGIYWKLGPR